MKIILDTYADAKKVATLLRQCGYRNITIDIEKDMRYNVSYYDVEALNIMF